MKNKEKTHEELTIEQWQNLLRIREEYAKEREKTPMSSFKEWLNHHKDKGNLLGWIKTRKPKSWASYTDYITSNLRDLIHGCGFVLYDDGGDNFKGESIDYAKWLPDFIWEDFKSELFYYEHCLEIYERITMVKAELNALKPQQWEVTGYWRLAPGVLSIPEKEKNLVNGKWLTSNVINLSPGIREIFEVQGDKKGINHIMKIPDLKNIGSDYSVIVFTAIKR